ncbi:unnamed protein product, partial [Callosobruchus maculatus]
KISGSIQNFRKRKGTKASKETKSKIKTGNFVLVKLLHRGTEYCYVAMCTSVEEDDEVVFRKICDNTAKNSRELMIEMFLFIHVYHDQILEKLRKDSDEQLHFYLLMLVSDFNSQSSEY